MRGRRSRSAQRLDALGRTRGRDYLSQRDYLNQSGVPFENRTDAILTAKQCCLDMSRQGGTTYQAANNLVKQEGWTQSEAQTFVQAAVPT